MEYVDYQKLAEQYASFLVAIGGVSITVLAIVLTLRPDSAEPLKPTEGDDRSFLVTALVVAALSCFVGAQMMAETAAFTNYTEPVMSTTVTEQITSTNVTEQAKPTVTERVKIAKNAEPQTLTNPTKKADRLFLLASSNIFIAIVLVFFALIFLPLSYKKVYRTSIRPIAILFFLIVAGALYWAVLAGLFRMRVPDRWFPIVGGLLVGFIWGVSFWRLSILNRYPNSAKAKAKLLKTRSGLLKRILSSLNERLFRLAKKLSFTEEGFVWATFTPSALVTIVSLAWFAAIYSNGDPNSLMHARRGEAWFFSFSIAISYASLVVVGIEKFRGKQFTEEESAAKQSIGEQTIRKQIIEEQTVARQIVAQQSDTGQSGVVKPEIEKPQGKKQSRRTGRKRHS